MFTQEFNRLTINFFQSGKIHSIAIISGLILSLAIGVKTGILELLMKGNWAPFVILLLASWIMGYFLVMYDFMIKVNQLAKTNATTRTLSNTISIIWYSVFLVMCISLLIWYGFSYL